MTAIAPLHSIDDIKIAVIGLGYVGLPLAVEFGKQRSVLGFDINAERIAQLRAGVDRTLEVEGNELAEANGLAFSSDPEDLNEANFYIVTVPTPIDGHRQPDLSPLIKASEVIAKVLKPSDVVVYESTVYPGATEEVCVPVLERASGLRFNLDFFCGYSPERINPGDKEHRLPSIRKVTSGSTNASADLIDEVYQTVVKAGTFKAHSIRVAEAAKVIENTQRDLNIALVNELAIIFNRLGIDTEAVIEAAATKWNFMPFRPGLVGGHCIGVDPYYLTHKAQAVGYHPEIILAGRRLNDGMGSYIAGRLVKRMVSKRIHVCGSNILVMGVTFKENCPDIRNTKVIDVIRELESAGASVHVYDPWADSRDVAETYCVDVIEEPLSGQYDAIIISVGHDKFRTMGTKEIRKLGKPDAILFDLKSTFEVSETDLRL